MREAVAALESALRELEQALSDLPEDMRPELSGIIDATRRVLGSMRRDDVRRDTDESAEPDEAAGSSAGAAEEL